MKHFEPPYGETPLSPDELEALLPDARYVLGGDTINKLAVYDFEQAIQDDVAQQLVADVLSGEISLATLLSEYDRYRDPSELAVFISTRPLGG